MTSELVVVALASLVAGSMLKSISGLGLPLVTIPAISYVADIETAVAITSVPNVVLNGTLAWRERGHWPSTRDLVVLGGFGFAGAIVGTLALVSVADELLIGLLVAVVLAYATAFFVNPRFRIEPSRARRLAPVVGTVAGAMQGAVGISGPIVASWIHAYRLPRNAQILSVTALFAFAGVAQIPTLAANGSLDGIWPLTLVACVPALATIPVGERLRNAVSSQTFDRIVVVVLVTSTLGLAIRTFG